MHGCLVQMACSMKMKENRRSEVGFSFKWASDSAENDAYLPFLNYLLHRNKIAHVISNGQNCANRLLFQDLVIYSQREQIHKTFDSNMKITGSKTVRAMFTMSGLTDIVVLRKKCEFISRTNVLYAFEIKRVQDMDQPAQVSKCLREVVLQVIGLNAYNSKTSPPVILTNLNGKHYVAYVAFTEVEEDLGLFELEGKTVNTVDRSTSSADYTDDDVPAAFDLKVMKFHTLDDAIVFTESVILRGCVTADFSRGPSPLTTPRIDANRDTLDDFADSKVSFRELDSDDGSTNVVDEVSRNISKTSLK